MNLTDEEILFLYNFLGQYHGVISLAKAATPTMDIEGPDPLDKELELLQNIGEKIYNAYPHIFSPHTLN